MKRYLTMIAVTVLAIAFIAGMATAATQQQIQDAIDNGLAYLASTMTVSGTEGYFPYPNEGTLAATASAALAFIEEGYLPNDGSMYGTQVGQMCNYIFNRAKVDTTFGAESHGYAEDYNNDGVYGNDGGNNQAIFFDPASYKRDVYTNGIVAPVVYSLGQALGKDTTLGYGSAAVSGMTYSQVMQDLVDWFSWGQNNPGTGVHRGGWRYTPNYGSSDNSTAQWGSLPMLYGDAWGLGTPQFVMDELNLYINYIQHSQDGTYKAGGSGYDHPNTYVNPAKTGGLMLELAAIGADSSDPRLANALSYLTSMLTYDHWNQGATYSGDQWYGGHLDNPYAMWAVYKALETWGYMSTNDNGTPLDPSDDFLVGYGISSAAGGITIGQEWSTQTSLAGDWYSQYCELLTSLQNADGSWNGFAYWYGALAAGWYINILNAAGAPPPVVETPEPITLLLVGLGLLCVGVIRRKS